MFHEPSHNRPHVHIGNHYASFAINDGSLLAGQCDTKAEKVMKEWIAKNRDTLLKMWEVLQNGLPEDYINILKESLNSNETGNGEVYLSDSLREAVVVGVRAEFEAREQKLK